MPPLEIVHNVLILALSGLCWATIALNWRWQRTAKRIEATRDEAMALVTEQGKHIADLQQRVHAAYAVLVTIAHAPMPADDKVAICASFLRQHGVNGTVEVHEAPPPATSIH